MTKVRNITPTPRKEAGGVRTPRPFTHSMEEFFENAFPRRWMEGLFEPYAWKRPFWNETGEMFELSTRIDMIDKGDALLVRAELPGITKEDLEITLAGDRLVLEANRNFEEEVKDDDFVRREMAFGRLSRAIRLPCSVHADKAMAELHDGVLELRLPKVEVTTPYRVKVA